MASSTRSTRAAHVGQLVVLSRVIRAREGIAPPQATAWSGVVIQMPPTRQGAGPGYHHLPDMSHKGKLYWFYGDTGRLAYALGNFAMAGATTDLPEKLD